MLGVRVLNYEFKFCKSNYNQLVVCYQTVLDAHNSGQASFRKKMMVFSWYATRLYWTLIILVKPVLEKKMIVFCQAYVSSHARTHSRNCGGLDFFRLYLFLGSLHICLPHMMVSHRNTLCPSFRHASHPDCRSYDPAPVRQAPRCGTK
jgi:hypothetical protein